MDRKVIQIAWHEAGGLLHDRSYRRSKHHKCETCESFSEPKWVYEWHVHSTDGERYPFQAPCYNLPKPGTLVLIEEDGELSTHIRWKIIKTFE